MHRFGLSLFAAVALAMSLAPQASAQQASAHYVVTYIETAPGSQREAAELIKKFGETSRNDTGNLRFDTLQRIGVPYHFAILEAWSDKAAAEAHAAAAHTKQFRDFIQKGAGSPYDERLYKALP